jgi:hypothetical protein
MVRSHTTMSVSGMRDCPFCAEPVRNAAVLCPHCRSDLPPFEYVKAKRSGKLGSVFFWLVLGSLGMYVWQASEYHSEPSAGASTPRTETPTSTASPTFDAGYCTKAQHEKDRVTMAFTFGSGVLQNLPEGQGFGVLINDNYWAKLNYRAKVGFMRSLDCAVAGPGKALATTDVRSQRSGALLAKWEGGKLDAP